MRFQKIKMRSRFEKIDFCLKRKLGQVSVKKNWNLSKFTWNLMRTKMGNLISKRQKQNRYYEFGHVRNKK